jgi:hypothetical protein
MSRAPHLHRRLRRGGLAALALSLALLSAGIAADVLAAPSGLDLGTGSLQESRTTRILAPGVKLTRISRGVKAPLGGWTAADPDALQSTSTGPWRIRLLAIDPRHAGGHLRSTFGSDVGRTETTSAMARAAGAVAGTNGGYFSIHLDTASRGNPAGLSIHDGIVESEPTNYPPETHFLLDAAAGTAQVTKLTWRGSLTHRPSGTSVFVDHVNQAPDLPEGCGGPRRDPTLCLSKGEVSVFTADWGPITPAGSGVETVLDASGCLVKRAERRGTFLSTGQISVQATGLDTSALLNLVSLGCLERTDKLRNPAGHRVALTPSTFAVNGRYQLVRAGGIVAPTGPDPFLARAPRTVAGTAADGRILLLTIDGRSRRSVGATLQEAAQVAKSVGMVEAVNLDGGGSTTMSINGHTANKPSDGHERPVGDALVYVPAPWRPEL